MKSLNHLDVGYAPNIPGDNIKTLTISCYVRVTTYKSHPQKIIDRKIHRESIVFIIKKENEYESLILTNGLIGYMNNSLLHTV